MTPEEKAREILATQFKYEHPKPHHLEAIAQAIREERSEVEQLATTVQHQSAAHDFQIQRTIDLKAENVRLREALKAIRLRAEATDPAIVAAVDEALEPKA